MRIKKLTALILTMTMMFTLTTSISFGEGTSATSDSKFPDLKGHWAETIIKEAAAQGIINGYVDGSFRPDNLMKREEFFKLISNVLTVKPNTTATTLKFSDADPIEWYIPTIKTMVEAGITNGYDDGKVGIGLMISRQEAAKLIASVIFEDATINKADISKVKDAYEIAPWAYTYAEKMFKKGYMQGDEGYFRPTKAITRAEAATILLNVKKNEKIIAGPKNATTTVIKPTVTTPTAVTTTSGALLGTGTKGDPYIIATANDLNRVRDHKSEGAFFVLKNDIKITMDYANDDIFDEKSKTNWKEGNFTPIGSKEDSFKGYFDGNGYSISGLTVKGQVKTSGNLSMANYAGLFGYLDKTSVVENLTIENSQFTGKSNTGAVAGLNMGTIEDCIAESTVTINGSNQTGGITGTSEGILKNNINKGTVIGDGVNTGGIAGAAYHEGDAFVSCQNRGNITGENNTGGIVGMLGVSSDNTSVKLCTNKGSVTAAKGNAGGIAGLSNDKGIAIEKCKNQGAVSSRTSGGIVAVNKGKIGYCYNEGEVNGSNYGGGIAGSQSETGSKIFESANSGNVTSYSNAGGIAGSNDTKIYACYNTGKISGNSATGGIVGNNVGTIWNVYNAGKIEGEAGKGALIGRLSGELENSFWLSGTCDIETGIADSGSKRAIVKIVSEQELSGQAVVKVSNQEAIIVEILNKDFSETVWSSKSEGTYLYPQLVNLSSIM